MGNSHCQPGVDAVGECCQSKDSSASVSKGDNAGGGITVQENAAELTANGFSDDPVEINDRGDGSRFEGQWTGKGRRIYPNGDIYEGNFLEGKAHGNGKYVTKQSTFVGQWEDDLKHGAAEEVWDDNSKYTGQYASGQRHGQGRYEWPDGSVYEGSFLNNNNEGEGTFTWTDGRSYKGQWLENRMHGEGRYAWPDGRAYEGRYVKDAKEGEGTFLWADGRKFTGQWKDGKQHGVGVFRTADGDQRTGKWHKGVRQCWVDEEAEQQQQQESSNHVREQTRHGTVGFTTAE